MKKGWMVRAGESGRLFEEFEKGYIAVGWVDMGDVSKLDTREKMAAAYITAYPDSAVGRRPNDIAMIDKFRNEMAIGDTVITYDPQSRHYLVGETAGDYVYSPKTVGDYPQTRKVKWLGKVSRDA